MDPERLAALLRDGQHDAAAMLVAQHTFPQVTSLREDRISHDLAPDSLEILSGTFAPWGRRVLIDVSAAYSFVGKARGALLLYVGQPEDPGTILYDAGGAPVPGATWYPVGSVDGESAWAQTTHRRLVLDVDPRRQVTWQLLGAIVGGAATVPVPQATRIAITPDGTTAFVTSPAAGTVTPIALGRPGYSNHQSLTVGDAARNPVPTRGRPGRLAVDDEHVVVCNGDGVAILSVADDQIVRHVAVAGGPTDCALTPDGSSALVATADGAAALVTLATGDVIRSQVGGRLQPVAVSSDGRHGYVGDAERGAVHRLDLADLRVEASIPVTGAPQVLRVAPDVTVWALCDPGPQEVSSLAHLDVAKGTVLAAHALPFSGASDMALVATAGQSSDVVRTAWVVFAGGRYCQFLIGGRFAGQPHSFHHGALDPPGSAPGGVALNDFGEIWVAQPDLDRVWKWPGGRFLLRADPSGHFPPAFFGEYCDVAVYGARP